MLHYVPVITPEKAARVAGIGYAMLFALGFFANFFVRGCLIDPEFAGVTFANVAADETLVRFALELLSGTEQQAAFEQGKLDAMLIMSLDAFNATWIIGLAAFGIHLVLLGSIILRAGIASKVLCVIPGVGRIAYVVDTLAFTIWLFRSVSSSILYVDALARPHAKGAAIGRPLSS